MSNDLREGVLISSKVRFERTRPSGDLDGLEKKGQNCIMSWSSTERHHFEPSHQSCGAESLKRGSKYFKGVDASFSYRRQCPKEKEEEVACIERALASFHAAVATDYGLEEAARAAADWIEEFEKIGTDEHPDWRSVTARAAHRLALRVVERHSCC